MADPVRLTVRLTPKGGRDAVDGWVADAAGRPMLKARVSAPPADGAANAALIALLAKTLKTARSNLTIVAGETARVKTIAVEGLEAEEIAARLGRPQGL